MPNEIDDIFATRGKGIAKAAVQNVVKVKTVGEEKLKKKKSGDLKAGQEPDGAILKKRKKKKSKDISSSEPLPSLATTSTDPTSPPVKKKKKKSKLATDDESAPLPTTDDEPPPKSLKRPAPETVLDPSVQVVAKKPKLSKAPISGSNKKDKTATERFKDSRGTGPRRQTDEGFAIFKEDELGISNAGGDTPLCPFDCDCCF